MVQQTVQMTADELLRLTDDAHRYELVRGELRQMSPAGAEHGNRAMRFGATLYTFVRQHQLGVVFAAETGFILQTNPDTVRAPDVSFVRAERLPKEGLPAGYLPIAPDLAVEVISPSETAEEIQEKVQDYLKAGTEQVWLLYRRTGTIIIHHRSGKIESLHDTDVLDGGNTIPGFRIAVADIFAP
jgi:Uma2 family endonuclease